ncbi:hypothetical protein A2W39_00385 [Candidatus Azambacteria bacterium RIFCSPHIGHO2_01_46_10]|uniref:Uncharacterized protein n=4 Tax=Candidatus Azamiibacteriota TaxID=1752741 RepID=A0A1F5C933_9BACT|nr:MAG: hypothetical protein A2W60_02585 [Candidatus Azambacteria bacterium RIFCSPHIGHO2_02_46_12]OGD35598.1 MAG: hypothetical protein A2W39_00385 [Candidatus Azambacteria bacterium RIFCSPHIGHO2_01_46_10]OGD39375.1 MAG: hypothetical protein A3A25_03025 [Candidatus Azambacteria bacterium RIFCSPLOWO2_01_FULL_46_26]OGD43230.1 MAG: hypothetical protein A3J02_02720 [Candidatus Azambacteria bacterium RIFCSPLOWO2_02_FULL_46_11]HBC58794.1 hypothetical protein [Candidatus Azambacteria bacterium]
MIQEDTKIYLSVFKNTPAKAGVFLFLFGGKIKGLALNLRALSLPKGEGNLASKPLPRAQRGV